MSVRSIFYGAALLFAGSFPAAAGTQLYPDSQLVLQDRFSDEIVGHGPDLVLIPGLSASRQTWQAIADSLKTRYRLHLIQVAGFAGEPPRANASGPVLVPTAEALDAYFVAQHLTPAVVIGHSFGGTMTLYLAEHHPEHLKKVMLVDALPFYSVLIGGPNATPTAMAPMAEQARKAPAKMPLSDMMLASMASVPEQRAAIKAWSEASDTSAVNNAFADDVTLDLKPQLAAIALPVTLVYPDYAPIGLPPGSAAARYSGEYAALKGIKLVEIANSVHFVMFDQPAAFAKAVEEFLK